MYKSIIQYETKLRKIKNQSNENNCSQESTNEIENKKKVKDKLQEIITKSLTITEVIQFDSNNYMHMLFCEYKKKLCVNLKKKNNLKQSKTLMI